ncbi:MAG: hypothetical protein RL033_7054 [Pseudomonadota bacterium]|jgi:hypothetical protein
MKSGKPLVLMVNRSETARRAVAPSVRKERSHLRLVSVAGQPVAGPVFAAPALVALPSVPTRRPPRSLSRPFGRRVVQVANDVAVLALALLSGLRPLA